MAEREHLVYVDDSTALTVYCATCALVLASYADTSVESHTLARMVSDGHWESYSKGHLVTITSIKDQRMEYIAGDNNYRDMTNND